MKKLFTLVVVVLMVVGAKAQTGKLWSDRKSV